jgi:hypothetical protein
LKKKYKLCNMKMMTNDTATTCAIQNINLSEYLWIKCVSWD